MFHYVYRKDQVEAFRLTEGYQVIDLKGNIFKSCFCKEFVAIAHLLFLYIYRQDFIIGMVLCEVVRVLTEARAGIQYVCFARMLKHPLPKVFVHMPCTKQQKVEQLIKHAP